MVVIMTRLRRFFGCAASLVPITAGCGASSPSSNPTTPTFSISPSTMTVDTNGQVQFKATLTNGQPATNVNWVIATGNNDSNLGLGSINSTSGLYYPPSALSKDSVQIQVQANLTTNVYQTATS